MGTVGSCCIAAKDYCHKVLAYLNRCLARGPGFQQAGAQLFLPAAEPHLTGRADLPLTLTAAALSSLIAPKCHRKIKKPQTKPNKKTPTSSSPPTGSPRRLSISISIPERSNILHAFARAGNDCSAMKHLEYFA